MSLLRILSIIKPVWQLVVALPLAVGYILHTSYLQVSWTEMVTAPGE